MFSKFNRISEVKINDIENKRFKLFFELFKLEWQQSPVSTTVITQLLKTLIYKLNKVKQEQLPYAKSQKYDLDLFDKLQQLLDNHITENRSVEFYAGKLNVTPRKLNDTIKAVLQKTTIEVIAERLLIEAKRALLYSGDSITQTSYNLGFEDNSYFTKFFKKHTNLTPKEFIQQKVIT